MIRLSIISLITFIVFSGCGNKQSGKTDDSFVKVIPHQKVNENPLKKGLKEGVPVVKVGKTAYDDLRGIAGDTIYYSSYKGLVEFADTISKVRKPIADLKILFLLDKLYVIPIQKSKWFFFWEETDYEGIKSYAALYETNGQKPIWKVGFPNPNPTVPVVDGNDAYLATLGMVAKISLKDGKLIWKQDSLFNQVKLTFQNIKKPLVYEDKVVFVDKPAKGRREKRDTLILDPITGARKK